MSALGNLVVSLSLEHAAFTQGLDKGSQEALKFAKNTQDAMDRMERSVQGFIGKVAGIGAAYLSLNSVYSSINKQVNALAQLDDAAQKTGASVELLSKIQKTAIAFGEDFGTKIEPAITKLAKGIAGLEDPSNKANAALKALGIQSRDSNGQLRDAAQITIDVAKALQSYRDDASKAALVTDLFGKTGAELLPFLNDAAANVDKFSGVSAEAAGNAAALQDSINAQKQSFDEFTQQLTVAVLPAITDLAGAFLDVQKQGNSLANDKAITGWADGLALSIAPLYDTFANLKNEIFAVGKSFQVVYADIQVAAAQLKSFNPAAYLSGDPQAALSAAQKNRQRTLIEANNAWEEMANRPSDEFEQVLRKRIANRPNAYASPTVSGSNANKSSLGYISGQENANSADAKKTATEAEAAKKAYDTLTDSINKQIEAKRAEYSVTGPLSDAEKTLLDVNLKRADGQLKLTEAQYANVKSLLDTLEAETRNAEMSKIRLQAEQDYLTIIEQTTAARSEIYTTMQDETTALEDLAKAKVDEIDQMRMTKAEIDALNVARYDEQIGILETQKAYLESQPERENEIELIERQIEALKTLRGTVGQAEAINKSKAETDAMFGSMENAARLVWTVFANSGENAAKAAGAAIKASILDLLYQMTIKKFFIQVQASITPTGAINDLVGTTTGNPNASIIDRIADGFKSINTTFSSSIEKLGVFLSNGNGGLADKIGGFLGQYSNQIADGLGYLSSAYMLSQGNIAGAALTAVGTYFGGPIGGAIGGAIGSLFGGKKKIPRFSTQSNTLYNGGDYQTNTFTPMYKALNAGAQTTGLNEAYFDTLAPLFKAFDIEGQLQSASTRILQKRKASYGNFNSVINGQNIALAVQGSAKNTQATFENLINSVLTTGITNAVNASSLGDGLKSLFDGLTDKTQIGNMINASIILANTQDSLASAYNLTADRAAAVAKASGLAGDSLAAFVGALSNASLSQQSAASVLLKEQAALAEKLGVVPTTLKAFDAMLKAIDTTTAEGKTKFAEMFGARDRVSSLDSAFSAITTARDNAVFGLLSESEQMAISQQKLAEAFAEVNAEVPGSRDELVKWINGLDMTTEAGLKAAMAVPALVDAFQAIEQNANSTTNALREMSRFTNLADYRFYKGVANNYGNTVANDYVRASGAIQNSSSGKATINGADVDVLAELKAMRLATQQQASDLNRILKVGLKVQA